jgi:hypothetical protein
MIRAERISRILKLAQQDDFPNIGEDWDLEKEERNIQEQSEWDKFLVEKKEVDEDKAKRLKNPTHGWDPDTENIILMHKHWLKKYLGYSDDDDFIMENLKTLNSFYNHGKAEPTYLGSGSYGTAYLLGDGKVLKITDSTHANVKDKTVDPFKAVEDYYDLSSSMIFDEVYGADTELMVFKQGKLFKYKSPKFNWIIMEKVKQDSDIRSTLSMAVYGLEPLITSAIGYINSEDPPLSTNNAAEYFTRAKIEEIKVMTKDIKRRAIAEIPHIPIAINKFSDNEDIASDWLDKLIEQMIIKTLSGKWDFSMNNMGLRESTGHFIFFDA